MSWDCRFLGWPPRWLPGRVAKQTWRLCLPPSSAEQRSLYLTVCMDPSLGRCQLLSQTQNTPLCSHTRARPTVGHFESASAWLEAFCVQLLTDSLGLDCVFSVCVCIFPTIAECFCVKSCIQEGLKLWLWFCDALKEPRQTQIDNQGAEHNI